MEKSYLNSMGETFENILLSGDKNSNFNNDVFIEVKCTAKSLFQMKANFVYLLVGKIIVNKIIVYY